MPGGYGASIGFSAWGDELCADRAAFDAHEAQPHTQRFLSEREQYLAGVEVTFLDVMAGKIAAQQ